MDRWTQYLLKDLAQFDILPDYPPPLPFFLFLLFLDVTRNGNVPGA